MKRSFQQRFPGMTAAQFVQLRLRDADFEKQIHNNSDGALLEWSPSKYTCRIRFRINMDWSEPVQRIMGNKEVVISEKREFNEENAEPQKVSSVIKTNFAYLSASISRIIEDVDGGCMESLTLEINYQGETFRDQIANDFFKAVARHVFPLNSNEVIWGPIDRRPSSGLLVPPKHTTQYLAMHSELQSLRDASERYQQALEKARLNRMPLQIPNTSQIQEIIGLLEPSRFSIQNDIDLWRAETDRTKRIVEEIHNARKQVSSSSSLPAFILATCAAVVYFVVARTS